MSCGSNVLGCSAGVPFSSALQCFVLAELIMLPLLVAIISLDLWFQREAVSTAGACRLQLSQTMLAREGEEWRVLIICCDKYEKIPLKYCYRSAMLVMEKLQGCLPHRKPIQFVRDPDAQSLKDACDEFVKRPTANQNLFLYFAGHGFEKDGRLFMVPIKEGPSFCLQDLRLKLEKRCVLFVAWDACRVHTPFYPDEPLVFQRELLAVHRYLTTDYFYLFSCLSGEKRFDDLEFAKALSTCFCTQGLKLTEVVAIVKETMPKHRVDSTVSLPPTAEELQHLSFQDGLLCRSYWTPCLYVVATILDLAIRLGAAQGLTHIHYSTRVTFLISMTSFFWAAFSHSDIQHTPACSIRLVNELVRHWEVVEFIAFRLRTPVSVLCQVFSELYCNLDAAGAVITLSLGTIWFVLSGYFLAVIRRWRYEASALSHARSARLWMFVFSYASWVAASNFRMLWEQSDPAGRWVEVNFQTYLLFLLVSLSFTLIFRCDPSCNLTAPRVAAYSLLPASSILAVTLFVLWQGVALQIVWLTGLLLQYLALFGLGLVVYIWQCSSQLSCWSEISMTNSV